MPSERVQRQIDRLLDEAEQASAERNWALVRERCEHVLTFDPENEDALALLAAAERGLGNEAADSRRSAVGDGDVGSVGAQFIAPDVLRVGDDALPSGAPELTEDTETHGAAPNSGGGRVARASMRRPVRVKSRAALRPSSRWPTQVTPCRSVPSEPSRQPGFHSHSLWTVMVRCRLRSD